MDFETLDADVQSYLENAFQYLWENVKKDLDKIFISHLRPHFKPFLKEMMRQIGGALMANIATSNNMGQMDQLDFLKGIYMHGIKTLKYGVLICDETCDDPTHEHHPKKH